MKWKHTTVIYTINEKLLQQSYYIKKFTNTMDMLNPGKNQIKSNLRTDQYN